VRSKRLPPLPTEVRQHVPRSWVRVRVRVGVRVRVRVRVREP